MRYLIEHETTLEYQSPVSEHHIELRLTPREDRFQKLINIEITTEPRCSLRSHYDYFGNHVHAFEILPMHTRLVTRVRAEVENSLENPFDYQVLNPVAERDWIRDTLRKTPTVYDYILSRSPATPCLDQLDESFDFPRHEAGKQILESVQAAMGWVASTLAYEPGVTSVHTTLAEALQARAGVCQDFAHLLISIVRSWKVPARYVMGYLASTESAEIQAAAATHAWVEVLIPGNGWTGFDATQGILTNNQFISVAVGRDYQDAAPQRGSYKGEAGSGQPEVILSISQQ